MEAFGEVEAEGVCRRERGQRVGREMPRGEVDLEPSERRVEHGRVEGPKRDVLADAHDLEVGAVDREPCWEHGDAAGRERCDELTLRAGYALEVAHLLQMHRADVRDYADVRLGERAELGDLAKAAHRQLEDAELGVRLHAADRQRDADLGVVAPLGGDGSQLRLADRGEDVFCRGLAHRAGDRDEPSTAPLAHAAGERRERREHIVWNKRRGCPAREGVLDEVGAAADRDEQVALLDPARVRLQARHLGGPRRCLELPRGELRDFGE